MSEKMPKCYGKKLLSEGKCKKCRHFVFTENEGFIEAVYWCKTLDEAKQEARQRKKKHPSESKQVYIGQLLV